MLRRPLSMVVRSCLFDVFWTVLEVKSGTCRVFATAGFPFPFSPWQLAHVLAKVSFAGEPWPAADPDCSSNESNRTHELVGSPKRNLIQPRRVDAARNRSRACPPRTRPACSSGNAHPAD